MSQTPPQQIPNTVGVESEPSADERVNARELLELLNDEYTRTLLASLSAEAKPARRLVEDCDASRATVYRRLNRLEDAGLVASSMSLDPEGHHRKRYRATFREAAIGFADGEFTTETVTLSRANDRTDPANTRPR